MSRKTISSVRMSSTITSNTLSQFNIQSPALILEYLRRNNWISSIIGSNVSTGATVQGSRCPNPRPRTSSLTMFRNDWNNNVTPNRNTSRTVDAVTHKPIRTFANKCSSVLLISSIISLICGLGFYFVSKELEVMKREILSLQFSNIKDLENLKKQIYINDIKLQNNEASNTYGGDKTVRPDFAREPIGGTILNTRCSETYDPYGVQFRLFGIPLWVWPTWKPSQWAKMSFPHPTKYLSRFEYLGFYDSTGYLVIKLSQPITPSGFSYEHIPKQISRDGNIDSAPKEFQVRGLDDESDTSGHLLGNYVYEDNGRHKQFFKVQNPNQRVYQLIEFKLISNHDQKDYTFLYRFEVFGH